MDAAAWLNANALVSLELDEGNKYAKGHPAAHGFPAVLALAAERVATGADTAAAALLAAYEVAARFGRAARLRDGAHPHGNWGVAGAARGLRPAARPGRRRDRRRDRRGRGPPGRRAFASATTATRSATRGWARRTSRAWRPRGWRRPGSPATPARPRCPSGRCSASWTRPS
ncbi:MmgE/PrpD family protein [Actinomadura sp. CNU-125]|uniref:MmgE/PrpD family protein n=1 Tax=Actinomadura sp. CNU-125 TaxID=1904961 RepID=UPI00396722BB